MVTLSIARYAPTSGKPPSGEGQRSTGRTDWRPVLAKVPTRKAEFQHVRDECRPQYLALHDTHTLKAAKVEAYLANHTSEYTLLLRKGETHTRRPAFLFTRLCLKLACPSLDHREGRGRLTHSPAHLPSRSPTHPRVPPTHQPSPRYTVG